MIYIVDGSVFNISKGSCQGNITNFFFCGTAVMKKDFDLTVIVAII